MEVVEEDLLWRAKAIPANRRKVARQALRLNQMFDIKGSLIFLFLVFYYMNSIPFTCQSKCAILTGNEGKA